MSRILARRGVDLLFIHPSDELYGADRVLLELLDSLPPGVTAEVWLPTDLEHPLLSLCPLVESRGVPVRHLNLPVLRRSYRGLHGAARLLRAALRCSLLLARASPEVVYLTSSATFAVAPLARVFTRSRVVGHVHEFWSPEDARILTFLGLACGQLVCISLAVRDALPRSLRSRSHVILNAVPDPGLPSEFAGGSDAPITYLVASRWNRWKGHSTLFKAWDLAEAPGRLVVLGGPPKVGERVDARALMSTLRRPATVKIVGEVADLGPYLTAADVVVMPSDDPEPFGLIAIEAFARQRPVIASNAGGLAEIVEDGCTGWLFPPRDARALAAVLCGITRAEAQARGVSARAEYEERFSPARYHHQWREYVLPKRP